MAELYKVIGSVPVDGVPKGGTLLLEPYAAEVLIEAGQLVKVEQPPEPAPIAITVKAKAEKPPKPKAEKPSGVIKLVAAKESLSKSPESKPEGDSAL